jgi:hypothetical protein
MKLYRPAQLECPSSLLDHPLFHPYLHHQTLQTNKDSNGLFDFALPEWVFSPQSEVRLEHLSLSNPGAHNPLYLPLIPRSIYGLGIYFVGA